MSGSELLHVGELSSTEKRDALIEANNMEFGIADLSVKHEVVKAGRLMLDFYYDYDGMYEPCKIVHDKFPQLSPEQVMCLWIGVNMAKCSIGDLEKIELVGVE